MLKYSESVIDGEATHNCTLFSKSQMKQINAEGFNLGNSLKMQGNPVGIDAVRKDSLVSVILPLVSEEKKAFWENLPIKKE